MRVLLYVVKYNAIINDLIYLFIDYWLISSKIKSSKAKFYTIKSKTINKLNFFYQTKQYDLRGLIRLFVI
jgi:hypothetical protein